MNKLFLFITILYVSLCCRGVYAQNAGKGVLLSKKCFLLPTVIQRRCSRL